MRFACKCEVREEPPLEVATSHKGIFKGQLLAAAGKGRFVAQQEPTPAAIPTASLTPSARSCCRPGRGMSSN